MRTQSLLLGSLFLLVGASATSVAAQTAGLTPRPTPLPARPATVVSDVIVSDQLLGAPIQDESGEALGTVEDALVDSSGALLAIAVRPAASVRADGQLTAVPVESLMPATSADAVSPRRVLRLRRETAAQLREAPAFARERWNEALSPEWLAGLREHFAVQAAGTATPERLSLLVGSDVVDSAAVAVGRVNALAVDLARREVAAAIVTPVEELGSRERLLPVPFTALRPAEARAAASSTAAASSPRRSLVVGLSLERLLNAPRFDRGDLSRLRSMLAAKDMRAFYAGVPDQRAAAATQRGGAERGGRSSAEPQRPAGNRAGGTRPSTPPRSESGAARGSGRPRAR
jgi:sporulation protein YlmC with PRC-barrel domain